VRALIGGVGYPDLSDHSISWAVVQALESRTLPAGVAVEDLSYNPIAVAQRLDDEDDGERYDTLVLVSAVTRGRAAGTVTPYRWDRRLPADEAIQRAVTDAVTGIIYLDNTLVVVGHLGALPERVVVVEVEPLVADQLEAVCDHAVRYAASPAASDTLPLCRLGGPMSVAHV
jgi:Ni,Fe-hydrogenase maturation factor